MPILPIAVGVGYIVKVPDVLRGGLPLRVAVPLRLSLRLTQLGGGGELTRLHETGVTAPVDSNRTWLLLPATKVALAGGTRLAPGAKLRLMVNCCSTEPWELVAIMPQGEVWFVLMLALRQK